MRPRFEGETACSPPCCNSAYMALGRLHKLCWRDREIERERRGTAFILSWPQAPRTAHLHRQSTTDLEDKHPPTHRYFTCTTHQPTNHIIDICTSSRPRQKLTLATRALLDLPAITRINSPSITNRGAEADTETNQAASNHHLPQFARPIVQTPT